MEQKVTAEDLRDWGDRYSNRGRWADDDRFGTLNFITRARVLDACALVRNGQIISCGLPQYATESAENAFAHQDPAHALRGYDLAGPAGSPEAGRDALHVALQRCTRWDSRVGVVGEDVPCVDPGAPEATEPNPLAESIDQLKNGVVGRGVLLDLPRFVRRPWLEDGTRIFPSDLDACAEASGVAVQAGDIVLLRTGKVTRARSEGWESYANGLNPGLSIQCARWLQEREIAAVASDSPAVEVRPGEVDGVPLPLHTMAIERMGLLLGQNFQLDDLARVCAEDETYEFLFTAPPLLIPTGGGSPINPLAIR